MKEEEAIDALFARGLRDLEAAPPPAAWSGIERERDWVHLTLLRLRRRWGLWSALLLAGGAAWYVGSGMEPQHEAGALATVGADMAVPAPPVRALETAAAPGVAFTALRTIQPAGQGRSGQQPEESTWEQVQGMRTNATVPQAVAVAAHGDEGRTALANMNSPANAGSSSDLETADRVAETEPVTAQTPVEWVNGAPLGTGGPAEVLAMRATMDRAAKADAPGVERLPLRQWVMGQEEAWPMPVAAAATEFRWPVRRWWLAATVANYAEERHWHGPEAWTRQAAELPHHRTGAGLALGMQGQGGWGVSLGAEFSVSRADYRHLDRFTMRTDTVVPFVVTFNDQVLSNYMDTLTLWSEEERDVRAVNQWTALRFPLEASWHRGWRRWRFGLRGGMALELNSQRSGVALVAVPGGAQSVDVAAAPVRTTSVLLATTVGADIGFGLSDRFTLWATPGWSAGLFSLSRNAEGAYALPERTGVGFRLSYALQPRK
jgi:hypothetical protein